MSTATTVEEALWLQAHGANAVIAQGLEAGGRRGHFLSTDISAQTDTLTLVSRCASALGIPVIAAGGIGDAAGVRATMARGASAVQVGTAFLLSDEAATGALHRARLRDQATPTALTNLLSGGLARGLNRLMRGARRRGGSGPGRRIEWLNIAALVFKAMSAAPMDFWPTRNLR